MKQTSYSGGQPTRPIRAIVTWLALFLFGWVTAVGATGIYLNRPHAMLAAAQEPGHAESRIDAWPDRRLVTEATARAVARGIWPDEPVGSVAEIVLDGRTAVEVTKTSGRVVLIRPTGHYLVETSYVRRVHAPDGRLLDSKIRWEALVEPLQLQGWIDARQGALLVDLGSLALLLLGLGGVARWSLLPRRRRPLDPASRTG